MLSVALHPLQSRFHALLIGHSWPLALARFFTLDAPVQYVIDFIFCSVHNFTV